MYLIRPVQIVDNPIGGVVFPSRETPYVILRRICAHVCLCVRVCGGPQETIANYSTKKNGVYSIVSRTK